MANQKRVKISKDKAYMMHCGKSINEMCNKYLPISKANCMCHLLTRFQHLVLRIRSSRLTPTRGLFVIVCSWASVETLSSCHVSADGGCG